MACRRPLLLHWFFRAAAVVGGLVVAVLGVEFGLRLFPGVLNDTLRDAAFSRHDLYPGGIYLHEGITRVRFMRGVNLGASWFGAVRHHRALR